MMLDNTGPELELDQTSTKPEPERPMGLQLNAELGLDCKLERELGLEPELHCPGDVY